jgi:hypothetical protein
MHLLNIRTAQSGRKRAYEKRVCGGIELGVNLNAYGQLPTMYIGTTNFLCRSDVADSGQPPPLWRHPSVNFGVERRHPGFATQQQKTDAVLGRVMHGQSPAQDEQELSRAERISSRLASYASSANM